MRFVKLHGTRNDYVLVDARDLDLDATPLAQAMCDRYGGVGSDGLLLVRPSSQAALRMQMFNPDGSEAEMCGNGIRCFTKYAVESGLIPGKGPVPIQTGAGIKTVWPHVEKGRVTRVRVDMGAPILTPSKVPVAYTRDEGPVIDYPISIDGVDLRVTCVSMGNPHAIAFLDTPVGDFPLDKIGPKMEHHPFFPRRVNFSIVNILDRSNLRTRVWERGAGLTLSCGTGACAIMVASRLKGAVGDEIRLQVPGGVLTLSWDGKGPVYLEGPAEEVFRGEWPE